MGIKKYLVMDKGLESLLFSQILQLTNPKAFQDVIDISKLSSKHFREDGIIFASFGFILSFIV
jgi:hypothetical protein